MDLSEFTPARLNALLQFTRALTGDRSLAEDIVQDVLLKLHTRDGPPIDNLDAYARRMAVNHYISWRRKWSRVHPVEAVEDTRLQPDANEDYADLADLEQRLSVLSRKQRAVLVLRYFADQSDAQIAETLGCRPGAVRALAFRALTALRVEYAADGSPTSVTSREALT